MTVSASTTEEISASLTDNCALVSGWMVGNRLKLNADKTHLMVVGTGARLRAQDQGLDVVMDGIRLQESEDKAELLLGCYIEPNLKWHKQVNSVLIRLQQRLNALEKLKNILPFNRKKIIVEGLFTSVPTYCLPVFGGCDKTEVEALQVMQNKAARLVTNSGIRTSRKEIFRQTGWMTVKQLIFYHTSLCTFRIRSSHEPEYLAEIMNRNNTRNKIVIPHSRLTLAMNSYCFRGSSQWNRLPEAIRSSSSINCFKNQLKTWIHSHVPQFDDA